MITIKLDDEAISNALAQAVQALSGDAMRGAMSDIGEYLLTSTQDRISRGGPAPDGTPWAPKTEATYQRYVASGEGVDRRTLIHRGYLNQHELHFASGVDFAELGVSAIYGAAMQFGAKKGVFGSYSGVSEKTGRKYSGVAPWGDIPARPFVGISQEDETNILDIISEALGSAFR